MMNRRHFLGLLAALPFARPGALAVEPISPTVRVGSYYARKVRKTMILRGSHVYTSDFGVLRVVVPRQATEDRETLP